MNAYDDHDNLWAHGFLRWWEGSGRHNRSPAYQMKEATQWFRNFRKAHSGNHLTADEAKRIRIALIFGDPAVEGHADPALDEAKRKLALIEKSA